MFYAKASLIMQVLLLLYSKIVWDLDKLSVPQITNRQFLEVNYYKVPLFDSDFW